MAIRIAKSDTNRPGRAPFHEHALTHKFCDGGKGVELGAAAHNPFGLDAINVAPEDDFEFYADYQDKFFGAHAEVDVWGEADSFKVKGKQDFIVSSHVVEHIPDLVGAFLHWNTVLKPGGVVVMIFPKRTALPKDAGRHQGFFSRAINQTQMSL